MADRWFNVAVLGDAAPPDVRLWTLAHDLCPWWESYHHVARPDA
jgi:hypothetical protein